MLRKEKGRKKVVLRDKEYQLAEPWGGQRWNLIHIFQPSARKMKCWIKNHFCSVDQYGISLWFSVLSVLANLDTDEYAHFGNNESEFQSFRKQYFTG
jgi:hypothetical protein